MRPLLRDKPPRVGHGVQRVGDVIGNPFIALLIAVLVAMFTFGVGTGMNRGRISESIAAALPPIAGILLIVSAGSARRRVARKPAYAAGVTD